MLIARRDNISLFIRALLSGLIALFFYWALNSTGIYIGVDGWALWQGAFNLIHGNGYRYFSGHPIVHWPPLYSTYLAGWMLVIGPNARAILLGNALLIGVQAMGWAFLALSAEPSESRLSSFLVALYVGAFVPLGQIEVLAHILLYTELPFLIIIAWRFIEKPSFVSFACLMAISIACVLTHTLGLVFVASSGLLILIMGNGSVQRRMRFFLSLTFLSALAWEGARLALSQTHSHVIGFGVARVSVGQNFMDAIRGIGNTIFPHVVPYAGFALLVGLMIYLWGSANRASRYGFAFAILSLTLQIALFSVTWVHDSLERARFVLFFAIITVPLAFNTLRSSRRWAGGLFFFAVLSTLVYRYQYWLVPPRTLAQRGYPTDFVQPSAEISPRPHASDGDAGLLTMPDGKLLIAPPRFEEPLRG